MTVFPYLNHFDEDEFDHPDRVLPLILLRLDWARERADRPIYVTSDFRPYDDDSAHSKGLALDISDNLEGEDIASRWRFYVLDALFHVGFHRIGIAPDHIHIDADPRRDPEVAWLEDCK